MEGGFKRGGALGPGQARSFILLSPATAPAAERPCGPRRLYPSSKPMKTLYRPSHTSGRMRRALAELGQTFSVQHLASVASGGAPRRRRLSSASA